MSVVYRIQDKDGRGPWRPGFSNQWVEDKPDEVFEALVPWPIQFGRVDKLRRVGTHIGCGCQTMDQLRMWFTNTEYSKLLGFGYQAVKMEADRILGESSIQCVFERLKPLREEVQPIELYP